MPRTPRVPRVENVEAVERTERTERVVRAPPVPRVPRAGFAVSHTAVPIGGGDASSPPVSMAATSMASGLPPSAIIDIPGGINQGLSSAKNSTMLQVLGMPRDTIDHKCRGVTKMPLKALITLRDVGPFRVTGVRAAVDSLERVMEQVEAQEANVFASLGTAGMLCVRRIKNSTRLSNHSWGCAVDIKINGVLDGLGSTGHDGKTLAGLAAMAPHFNAEGWFWGVGFSSFEDGMHFEVADETIRNWHTSGELGKRAQARTVTNPNLSIGDRGIEVAALQRALAAEGYDIIADGDFGAVTHGIVMDFQAKNELKPDGIVGPNTKQALGLT